MTDINAQRLAWLHSAASYNVDGYEWGIYRVKWVNGQPAEVWQTNADFSDLDAAMGTHPATASASEPAHDEAEKPPMSLKVALDFADNPRRKSTMQAPADTMEELRRALSVLATAYRWALASYAELESGRASASVAGAGEAQRPTTYPNYLRRDEWEAGVERKHRKELQALEESRQTWAEGWRVVNDRLSEVMRLLTPQQRESLMPWTRPIDDPLPLHPLTTELVARFAAALRDKLALAEKKYGYTDGWANPAWMDECRRKLMEHIDKGDPLDVSAYCAFLWHHGESTLGTSLAARPVADGEAHTRALNAALTYRNHDPEALDEQDAWVALIDAIAALARQAPAPLSQAVPEGTPEWTARRSSDGLRVVIDSADFEHDAALILTGDFESEAQRLWYAGSLADKLNAPRQTQPQAVTEDARDGERWRWLRENFSDVWCEPEGQPIVCVKTFGHANNPQRLDEAIDAARRAQTSSGKGDDRG